MSRKLVFVAALLTYPVFVNAQDFNDVPDIDDDQYLSLLFPSSSVPPYLLLPDQTVADVKKLATQTLIEYAYSKIGTPYHGGGTGNGSYDCSGFTQNVFKQIGLQLPHSSGAQASFGKVIELNEVQPGDLLFFKGRNRKNRHIGHVALVSEVLPDGTIKMVHATSGKGVMIDTPFKSTYYKSRYIGARRVLNP